MNERRISRRIYSNCPSITNIYTPKHYNANYRSKIPLAILRKIESTQNISCSFINNLPNLEPQQDFNLEINKIQEAVSEQLEEHDSFLEAEDENEEMPMDRNIMKREAQIKQEQAAIKMGGPKMTVRNILEDVYFLESLNDFIMGKPASRKQIPETDSIIQG